MSVIPVWDGMPAAVIEPDWSAIFSDEGDIAEAREQWSTVTDELAAVGTLATANGNTVTRLVEFRVQFRKAARHVAQHGAILAAQRAKVGQWNPYWAVMRQADERIVVLESKLGIDPVSRGKATKVDRGKKIKKAADAYLGAPGS
ncbi:P27 family phage terminase small subunit [Chelativorans sp. AA-79]|uniref:P27 family phage terminase small subunit n=1 Tax=Chelativorans sp. AA-79 TaxID=3028735 RepID=UPI0023F75A1B|nr:P27 family phage terminase small subunit [Chelativorans sp. AA-79]WEX07381.1 P27 family phage terminase small subunit [Chelativorans sp. AA-79]